MNIFLSMLFSSNLLFLCFLLCNHFVEKYLSVSWRNLILKLILFFSLVPIAFFKVLVQSYVLETLRSIEFLRPINNLRFTLSGKDSAILLSSQEIYLTQPIRVEMLATIIWFAVGSMIFLFRIYKYFHQREIITRSLQPPSDLMSKEVLALKKELKIRRPIFLYTNSINGISFTTGMFRPIIVISSGLSHTEFELVLRHELCHIKSGDNLYGFLRLFMLSLYWFNPLSYLLDYYIDKTSELHCDNMVVSALNKVRKETYCRLVIGVSSSDTENKSYLCNFSRDGEDIRERMINIMTTKKGSKKNKIISVLLAAFIVTLGSMPVFAYQSPRTMEISKQNPMHINTNTTVEFQTGNFEDAMTVTSVIYDAQFTDPEGNIYPVDKNENTRFRCEHSFVSGTFTEHTLHDDGSCTMEYYDAQRCNKCGYTSVGSLQQVVEYKYCPHEY